MFEKKNNELFIKKKITLFYKTYSEIILCCMTNRGDYNLLI